MIAANRVMQGMFMLLEAQRWVATNFPWWRRRGGQDHIWCAFFPPALHAPMSMALWAAEHAGLSSKHTSNMTLQNEPPFKTGGCNYAGTQPGGSTG